MCTAVMSQSQNNRKAPVSGNCSVWDEWGEHRKVCSDPANARDPCVFCGACFEMGTRTVNVVDLFVWGYKYNLLKLLPPYCTWGCATICWLLEIWVFLGSSQLEGKKRVREEIHYRRKQNRKGNGCRWIQLPSWGRMSFIHVLTTGYTGLNGDLLGSGPQ